MGTFKDINEAREFFKNDRFATGNGMFIEAMGEDFAVCSMKTDESHLNAAGTVMGGVYFTLADFAFAVCTNNVHKVSVAIDSNITFLTAARGGSLTARAQMLKSGKRTSYCQVEVKDEEGRLCAMFTGTVAKL